MLRELVRIGVQVARHHAREKARQEREHAREIARQERERKKQLRSSQGMAPKKIQKWAVREGLGETYRHSEATFVRGIDGSWAVVMPRELWPPESEDKDICDIHVRKRNGTERLMRVQYVFTVNLVDETSDASVEMAVCNIIKDLDD